MSLYSIYFLFLNKQVKVHPKGQDSPEFLQCCRNSTRIPGFRWNSRIPRIPAGISGGMKSIAISSRYWAVTSSPIQRCHHHHPPQGRLAHSWPAGGTHWLPQGWLHCSWHLHCPHWSRCPQGVGSNPTGATWHHGILIFVVMLSHIKSLSKIPLNNPFICLCYIHYNYPSFFHL